MTKRTYVVAGVLLLSGLCPTLQGCSQTDETATPGTTTPAPEPPATNQGDAAGQGVAIAFRSEPDPPAAGENTFEVLVTQPDGSPVTDATVETVFSMPAMPSMNMPAMRSTSALTHEGSGRYSGSGQLSMAGTWNVIVTATRGGEEIGRTNFSVIAK